MIANKATFFSPNEPKSNSSVWVSLLIESRLNFSNLLIKVICIDFNVLPAPDLYPL